MKIALFLSESNKRGCANKDLAGSMGTRTIIGNSLLAKILEKIKKKSVKIPIVNFAYLVSIFKKYGHEVEFWKNRIGKADVVIIQSSIVDFYEDLKWVRKIRKRKIKVGFCGAFASAMPELFLKYGDFVIVGEPENAAYKIAKGRTIPEGVIISPPIQELDSLPFPSWEIFPYKDYSYWPVIRKKPILTILTSRGCPFSCGYYCPYPNFQGKIWRKRSVENVINEIKYLIKDYQIKALDFRDPNFTLDKKRVENIAKEIIKNNIKVYWSCETHLNSLDKNLVKILYKAGLRNINVGIESGNEEVLKNSKRINSNKKHQKEIINYCQSLGISVAAFYILGLPSDTSETIKETIKYSQELNTMIAQFSLCTPYPGTKFYEEIKDKIFEKDWEKFDEYHPVFRHESLSFKELMSLKEKAWVSYYFRPKYIFNFLRLFFKDR
ncbi:MAG: B12-binding domain-containing radical SAM protein [Candidatus Omnitrophica bacterium]|nr:B12-binding domain-containing radical SAM protein [Candidatus Omnitrophota bacterium]